MFQADSGSDYTLVVDRRLSGKTVMHDEEDKMYEHTPCVSETTGQRLAHPIHHSDSPEQNQDSTPHPSTPSASTSSWFKQEPSPQSYQHNQQNYHTIGGHGNTSQALSTEYCQTATTSDDSSMTTGTSGSIVGISYCGTMPRPYRGNGNADWMNHTKV